MGISASISICRGERPTSAIFYRLSKADGLTGRPPNHLAFQLEQDARSMT